VMQSKNGWLLPAGEVSEEALRNKAGEVYVANGEFGIVVDIQDRSLIVRMLAPVREVRVGRYALHDESEEKDTGSSLQLAYAITVHKSQGSQAPHVAYMLDPYPGARRLTDRSLVYTAITRAKRATWLIGSLDLAHAACRRAAVFERKTYLAEAYRGQI
jgi:exodeoxyribonuclease V alpha subunit